MGNYKQYCCREYEGPDGETTDRNLGLISSLEQKTFKIEKCIVLRLKLKCTGRSIWLKMYRRRKTSSLASNQDAKIEFPNVIFFAQEFISI